MISDCENINMIFTRIRCFLSAPVLAYDRCFIFGDEFCSRSFEQYFRSRKNSDYNNYTKANFDVHSFFNNFTSDNPSVISRFVNLLVSATKAVHQGQRPWPLPKIIIIVPDDDLIQILHESMNSKGLAKQFSRILNFIMTDYERSIASFKESLPAKCLKQDYPNLLWIQAPIHDGFYNNPERHKFNRALDEVVKLHSNVYTLILKKVWDPKDPNLYVEEAHRFTAAGYQGYWEAVNKTIRYFDSVVLKNKGKKQKFATSSGESKLKSYTHQKGGNNQKCRFDYKKCNHDRFRWQNPDYNPDVSPVLYRKLPRPQWRKDPHSK